MPNPADRLLQSLGLSKRSAWWFGILATVFLWSYWPTLRDLAEAWQSHDQYSHGFLVPVLGAGLLWVRRSRLCEMVYRVNGLGLVLLAGAAAMRLGGAYFYYLWFDRISIVLCLAGLCLLLGGWKFFRWTLPALALLVFMVPLPYRFETALGWPLQRVATVASAYLLQTVGLAAVPEGNIIRLESETLEVARACSGLRMLLSFVTLSTAVALFVQRRWWERLTIFASSIPVALLCNILRITLTGMLIPSIGFDRARVFFHDVSGLLMMPLALLMLLGELWLLSRLLIEVQLDRRIAFPLEITRSAGQLGNRESAPHVGAKRVRPAH